jgi:hypothetical protein
MGLKALKGIAHGLLRTFVSRNNDLNGYWGLGVLRLFSETNRMPVITLELLDKEPNLSDSPIHATRDIYQKWFYSAIEKFGIYRSEIAQASISIRFSTFDELPSTVRDTRGEPYECIVNIVRVDGKKYQASKVGVCALHDPAKERRRLRLD